jgi:hypothetical protein
MINKIVLNIHPNILPKDYKKLLIKSLFKNLLKTLLLRKCKEDMKGGALADKPQLGKLI